MATARLINDAGRPVVLAGPGVVRAGCVPGLQALAAALSAGVLNTWGAKGVFDWRSPHHLATAGLQRDDWKLGGLADADLIIATGLDPDETRGDWRLAPVVEVEPGELEALAAEVERLPGEIVVPPLRERLAAMTQAGWTVEHAPLPPTRVTKNYSEVFGVGRFVAADPGVAGYWVARTFSTQELGSVYVPATTEPGLAAGAAQERNGLLVTDADPGDVGDLMVELWAPDGDRLDAAEHLARLQEGWSGVRTIATDPSQLDAAIDAAGPIIAWGGIDGTG